MELVRTGKVVYQIYYEQGLAFSKITQHNTVKSAEDELRMFKQGIKKEDLHEAMKCVKVVRVEQLDIVNLGKNLDK